VSGPLPLPTWDLLTVSLPLVGWLWYAALTADAVEEVIRGGGAVPASRNSPG
jgi:hypothetical protein